MNPRTLAFLALLVFPVQAFSAPKPVPPGHARPARFEVIRKYSDGPWLVPTLHAMRSADDWNNQMTRWLADQQVAGREAPPDINWNRQAVIVLSMGRQFGVCDVSVNHCTVEADTTLLDMHFLTPTQWDPNGDVLHPAILIAVDRSDLKNLLARFDCIIEGLPDRQGRRGNGITITEGLAPTSDTPTVEASFEAQTTWGRVKDAYRR